MAGWSCKDNEEIEWAGTIKAKKFLGKILLPLLTANPTGTDEGALILNTSNNSIYVYYLGDWRLLHVITISTEYLLTEAGEFIVQETGDKIIL